jgi:Protein of unknown function (DUF3082)
VRRFGVIAPMKKPIFPNSGSNNKSNEPSTTTPLRCFTGALTASTFSLLAYRLMLSIATNFANRPVTSLNPAVINISSAVRTLVVGMVALGAGIFGIAALGLTALGIQLLFKGSLLKKSQDTPLDTAIETAVEPPDTGE